MSPRKCGDARRWPDQCSSPNADNIGAERFGGEGGPSRLQGDNKMSTNPQSWEEEFTYTKRLLGDERRVVAGDIRLEQLHFQLSTEQ